jgi:hypothetical protein
LNVATSQLVVAGYDPAAVDAHLRELATQFEQLQRGGELPPSSPRWRFRPRVCRCRASSPPAEKASAEIERDAREQLQRTRDEALLDAARLREDAIERARTLVAAVTQARRCCSSMSARWTAS